MGKLNFDAEFLQDAECLLGECSDKDCPFCGQGDAEAAFWDEFCLEADEAEEAELFDLPYSIHIIDDQGQEDVFEEINFLPLVTSRAN